MTFELVDAMADLMRDAETSEEPVIGMAAVMIDKVGRMGGGT